MDTVVKPNMVKPCELVRARSREYASTLRSLAQPLVPSCCTSLTFTCGTLVPLLCNETSAFLSISCQRNANVNSICCLSPTTSFTCTSSALEAF